MNTVVIARAKQVTCHIVTIVPPFRTQTLSSLTLMPPPQVLVHPARGNVENWIATTMTVREEGLYHRWTKMISGVKAWILIITVSIITAYGPGPY